MIQNEFKILIFISLISFFVDLSTGLKTYYKSVLQTPNFYQCYLYITLYLYLVI